MDLNLLHQPLLGHWRAPSGVWQCEFQYGSRLVYVEHLDTEPPPIRLALAQRLIAQAWQDLPTVLAFAETHGDMSMTELVQLCKTHLPGRSPLFVYSIHFDLGQAQPSYAISKNPDFDWARTLSYDDEWGQQLSVCLKPYEPRDDFWMYVKRVGFQQFELAAT